MTLCLQTFHELKNFNHKKDRKERDKNQHESKQATKKVTKQNEKRKYK